MTSKQTIEIINKSHCRVAYFYAENYQLKLRAGESKSVLNDKYKEILFRTLDLNFHEIKHHPNGQPYFLDSSQLHLSISHSDGWFALIVGESPVGIDIQTKRSKMVEGASYYCNDHELQFSKDEHALHLMWCAKEAVFKKESGKFDDLKNQVTMHSFDDRYIHVEYNNQAHQLSYIFANDVYLVFFS